MKIALLMFGIWCLSFETWTRYVALMGIKARIKDLYPVARFHAYLMLAVGYLLDVATNVTLGSLLFARMPGLMQAVIAPALGVVALQAFPGLDPEWVAIGTVIALFAEPPSFNRLLLTARLTYHIRNSQGTRHAKVAGWLCSRLLDQFDNGRHCG